MHRVRLLTLALFALLLALTGAAHARPDATGPQTLAPPSGLHAFLLRADEAESRTFARTPSFAWNPVDGAWRYEFQLSTSLAFGEGTIVWESSDSTKPLRVPVAAVDVALPWITGTPYSLYARVRAVKLVPVSKKTTDELSSTPTGATGAAGPTGASGPRPQTARTLLGEEVFGAWSTPFGFNMRWTNVPSTLTPGYAAPSDASARDTWTLNPRSGLIQWTPVEGATAYDVWISGAQKRFVTTSNVADARDLFALSRNGLGPNPGVQWRVRAIRRVYGEIPNALPTTSYGPWSPFFFERYAPFGTPSLSLVEAVSGSVVSTAADPHVHEFTPSFRFTPDPVWVSLGNLYRVYVATDSDCVNIVFRGAAVPGPVYAPRATGALKLPVKQTDLLALLASGASLDHGSEGDTIMVDGTKFATTENGGEGTQKGPWGSRVDLWDTAWPNGGYYWTVVPVRWSLKPGATDDIWWHDTELPQDACQSGRVMRFGKTSAAVVASGAAPYASGLSPKGRLMSATAQNPSFYGTPLVSWEPALGADSYEIQWSKTGYPWKSEGTSETGSTAFMLPVAAGTWYYRVRGLNNSLPKKPQMTWSLPVQIQVAKPQFKVVGGAGGIVVEASGLVRYGSPAGFSLAVPPSWEVLANSTTAFQAELSKSDRSGVTVVFSDRRPPASAEEWKKSLKAEASATPGFVKGSLTASAARLPAGAAVKLVFKRKSGGVTLSVVRWVVFPGDREYQLTYTATPAQAAKLKAVSAKSADSFRLT